MYEQEALSVKPEKSIKQMRHIELLERVQQLPGYRAGDRELRVARLSRDALIAILLP